MAFPNAREQKKAFTDEELEAEKTQLLNEISALGIKVSEATEDHAKISQAIIDKKSELEKIEAAIASHAPTLEQHQNELEQIQAQIPNAQKLLDEGKELEASIIDKRKEHGLLSKEIEQLKVVHIEQAGDIDKSNKYHDEIRENITAAENEFELLKNAHDRVLGDLFNRENELKTSIIDLSEKVASLLSDADVHAGSVKDHQEMISDIKEDIKTAARELSDLEAKIEQTKSDEVVNAQNLSAALDAREKTIEAREGSVSLKEGWLKEKAKKLTEIKTEVEAHLGRKIPVTIPNEDVI
jgi:chromosome segregation ATPase